jgi:hypothetical protein
MFTEYPKKRMQDLLGYGLAMEGMAANGTNRLYRVFLDICHDDDQPK